MTSEISDEELASAFALADTHRYAYFLEKVAGEELLWSLAGDEGWVLAGDNEGHEIVPVWPHPRFAAACATGNWADAEPRSIELTNWMEKWIPGMLRDRRLVAVFPGLNKNGVVVTPARLQDDLQKELSLYQLQLPSLLDAKRNPEAVEGSSSSRQADQLQDVDLHRVQNRKKEYQ